MKLRHEVFSSDEIEGAVILVDEPRDLDGLIAELQEARDKLIKKHRGFSIINIVVTPRDNGDGWSTLWVGIGLEKNNNEEGRENI